MINRINPGNIAISIALFTPFFMIFSRGIASVALASVFLLLLLDTWRSQRVGELLGRLQTVLWSRNAVLVMATVAYCALSLFWTPAFDRGVVTYSQWVAVILVILSVLIMFNQGSSIEPSLGKCMAPAIALTSALILTELWLGSPLREMVGASTEPHKLNRAAVAVAILVPLLLLPGQSGQQKTAVGLVLLVGILACLFSKSESAKLAIFCGLTVWAIVRFLPARQMVLLISGAILLSFLAAPFAAILLHNAVPPDVYEAVGAGDHFVRSEIWWAYVNLIPQTPLFGRGFEASFVTGSLYTGSDERLADLLGYVHPHNFAIQIWYELGFLGALLFSALLAVLFKTLLKLPNDHHPVAFGMVTAAWTVAYVSHGAWQSWWWCLLGIVALLLVFMSRSAIAELADSTGRAHASLDQSA